MTKAGAVVGVEAGGIAVTLPTPELRGVFVVPEKLNFLRLFKIVFVRASPEITQSR